jgi:hypothetical protein
MANAQLNTPILTGGILNTNFFNGRVLAAEDLTTLQTANAQQRRQVARALGDGVAWGLEVTLNGGTNPTQPVVHVSAGLALNRKGDAVAMSADVDLALVKTLDVQAATNGLFAACAPPQTIVPTNLDCYILTASPASALQGSAPMTNLAGSGFASSCGSASVVEGVQFNLLPLGIANTSNATALANQALQLYGTLAPQFLTLAGLTDPTAIANQQAQIAPNLSQFQNVVAHLCFGTDVLQGFAANPFAVINGDSFYEGYGLLDNLRVQGYLTDCAVPLALVYWTAAGVKFVDMWSVRRPVFPVAASEVWPVFAGRRRLAEGLAMFLQFQAQVSELPSAALSSIVASEYFQLLPAVGVFPIDATTDANAGDAITSFVGNLTVRGPEFIEGGRLASLVSSSFAYPPIDLSIGEFFWLYNVRENYYALDTNLTNPPQAYLVFSNGHIPYQADARFDGARWDYSNYALG